MHSVAISPEKANVSNFLRENSYSSSLDPTVIPLFVVGSTHKGVDSVSSSSYSPGYQRFVNVLTDMSPDERKV